MNTPERIMVAKCHPFKEPDDLYVCHPRLQHPAAVEFTRADLCADPALLEEAVEVLRVAINGLDWAKIHTAEAGFESVAVNIAHAQVTAFLSKLENRHDR